MVDVSVSMHVKFQQLPVEFVKVLQLQFIDKNVGHSCCASVSGRRLSCRSAEATPHGSACSEDHRHSCNSVLGIFNAIPSQIRVLLIVGGSFERFLRGSCHEVQVLGDVGHAVRGRLTSYFLTSVVGWFIAFHAQEYTWYFFGLRLVVLIWWSCRPRKAYFVFFSSVVGWFVAFHAQEYKWYFLGTRCSHLEVDICSSVSSFPALTCLVFVA